MDDLVQYRLSSAKERLESARLLLDAGQYKDSIGRSYYAIFTAVRAVLARDQVDFSKHAGVIACLKRMQQSSIKMLWIWFKRLKHI